MATNKTVRINDRVYDAVTGLPVEPEKTAPEPVAVKATPVAKPAKTAPLVSAAAVHATPQRSQTLHRRATKKPGLPKRPQPGKHMDITRSSAVTRFAAHPATKPTSKPTVVTKSISPVVTAKPKTHPIAKKAVTRIEQKVTAPAKPTAQQIKNAAIAKALAQPTKKQTSAKKKRFAWNRRATIISGLILILLGAAFVTYLNLPTISVALASSQAGIEATYPKFTPDGYSLQQPVTYKNGEVVLGFAANAGASSGAYTITQSRSSWDSSAVLDNVVRKEAGDNYSINKERGLTIYTYDGNAAWVNSGILYVLAGDAPLSDDQIRRIAVSL